MKTYLYAGRRRDGTTFQGEVTARYFAEAITYVNGEVERLDSQATLLSVQELSDEEAILRSLSIILNAAQDISDVTNEPGQDSLARIMNANEIIHREVAKHLPS